MLVLKIGWRTWFTLAVRTVPETYGKSPDAPLQDDAPEAPVQAVAARS